MKKFLIVLGILLVTGTAVAVAMSESNGDIVYSWRYKMTVEIDTPEGVKTGSAVREVTVTFEPNSAVKSGYYPRKAMKGEAVVINLGKRGKVFALLKGYHLGVDHGSTVPFYVFNGPPGLTLEGAKFYSTLKNEKILTPTYYPIFVTFTDIDDPKTATSLMEMKSNDRHPVVLTVQQSHFEKYFGEGVKLKNIIIEMTDASINEDTIKKNLDWFGSKSIGLNEWNSEITDPAKYITSSDLKKEY